MFDGIEPDESLSPRTIEVSPSLIAAWEENLAKRDEDIAAALKCRAAAARNIAVAKRKLKMQMSK